MRQARKVSILFALTSMDHLLWEHLSRGTPGPDLPPRGDVSLAHPVALLMMPSASLERCSVSLWLTCSLRRSADLPPAWP